MIISLCAIALSTVGQVTVTGPRCSSPPRGATEACVNCYEDACAVWIVSFYECDGKQPCIDMARNEYFKRLQTCACLPALNTVLSALNDRQMNDAINILQARP